MPPLSFEKLGDFDFADLTLDFFAEAQMLPAHQDRFKAIGLFEEAITIVVVFYILGREGLSVISMRQASFRERKLFNDT